MEQGGADADGESMNTHINRAMSEDSLEAWPSLLHGSTSMVLPEDDSNIRFMLWASFAEIYNEQIFDLLESATASSSRMLRPSTLQLRDGDGRPYICGLREVHVTSAEEAWRLVQIGRENQHIASTRLNRASSRSHSIFTLRLIQFVDVDRPNVARVASLSFCDLAGSERNTASSGCNERLKEAGNINLSLMTLGRCIEALRKNQAQRDQSAANRAALVVPFRNSKLTRMFQSFLCGEGRVIMITNVSPCANVFDETLHAVNYSAIASQVMVGPSALPTLPSRGSMLGKQEAAGPTSKAAAEKKHKCEPVKEEPAMEEDEDESFSDADTPTPWKDERNRLLLAIKKLKSAYIEERQSKDELETHVRAQVCDEMQKQLVRIESEYQENIRKREEILEEKYDRKMEIYMEAVQKSCKRQRRADDEGDFLPNVELHAAEVKLSKYADEVNDLKHKIEEMNTELATARESMSKLSAERDALAQKLTESEFSASDAMRQEKIQARSECVKLQDTVEELTNKLNEAEHRHEVSCRQLRRDKAQLEQKLSAAEQSATNQNVDNSFTNDLTSKVTELEEALKNSQDTINDLQQRLNEAKENCVRSDEMLEAVRKELNVKEEDCEMLRTEIGDLKQQAAAEDSSQDKISAVQHDFSTMQEKLKQMEDEKAAAVDSLKSEVAALTTQLLEQTDRLNDKVSEIGQLENGLEEERGSRCRLEDAVSSYERKLVKAESDLNQEREKNSALHSSLEILQAELNVAKNACTTAEEERDAVKEQMRVCDDGEVNLKQEISSLSQRIKDLQEKEKSSIAELADRDQKLQETMATVSDLSQLVKDLQEKEKSSIAELAERDQKLQETTATVNDLSQLIKELQQKEKSSIVELADRDQKLQETTATVNDLSQRIKELQQKEKSSTAELADRDQKLQETTATVNDLSQRIKELQEREKSSIAELADRDHKHQETAATVSDLIKKIDSERGRADQMKSAMTEQEETMRAQDQLLIERDEEVQSLKERLEQARADHHHEVESLNDQFSQKNARIHELENTVEEISKSCERKVAHVKKELADRSESWSDQVRQKNSRIRELEKKVEEIDKSRHCLQKDVRDTTSELKTTERNLADAKKELAELEKQFHAFKVNTEDELADWREKRDKLKRSVLEKDAEIERLKSATDGLKTGRSLRDRHPSVEYVDHKMEVLQKKVEQLSRAASAKDQTIVDMREQNQELQRQICQLQQPVNVEHKSRKSRIPTVQRLPLHTTDENADVSVGVLADGGTAIDLDETVGHPKRSTRRYHTHEDSHPKPTEVVDRGSRTRRKRTTSILDREPSIAEEPEAQARRLRPRHH